MSLCLIDSEETFPTSYSRENYADGECECGNVALSGGENADFSSHANDQGRALLQSKKPIRTKTTGNPSALAAIHKGWESLDSRVMRWLVDVVYFIVLLLLLPVLLPRMAMRGKLRTDWRGRLGCLTVAPKSKPRVLLHAVSVGEVNALRGLVSSLANEELEVVVSVTTDTGMARAQSLFGDQHLVVRYPYDFSWAVGRFLRRVQPDVIALIELEVWPNMVAACSRKNIPVCVINGRLSDRSFKRYKFIRWLVSPSFRRLSISCVQSETYAERFRRLGATPVLVTDSMKWDNAILQNEVPGSQDLAESLGIDQERPLVVAGSTAPGEPELLEAAVEPEVQLLCAPRRPEWFDAAARAMPGCVRRSAGNSETPSVEQKTPRRFLLDTIGELRQAYALADIVVVGRSFGELFGSDVTEPVGLGKATIIGPACSDFAEMVAALVDGGGLIQIPASDLAAKIRALLASPDEAAAIANRGRSVIKSRQGATRRHARLLKEIIRGRDLKLMSLKEVAALVDDKDGDGEERTR